MAGADRRALLRVRHPATHDGVSAVGARAADWFDYIEYGNPFAAMCTPSMVIELHSPDEFRMHIS